MHHLVLLRIVCSKHFVPRGANGCSPPAGCEEYHFLHEGLCVPDCPERFFEDKERRECLRCHPDCALCDGPKANDCDACVDPEAALHNGACLAACPSHAYRDAITGECKGTTAKNKTAPTYRPASKTRLICVRVGARTRKTHSSLVKVKRQFACATRLYSCTFGKDKMRDSLQTERPSCIFLNYSIERVSRHKLSLK